MRIFKMRARSIRFERRPRRSIYGTNVTFQPWTFNCWCWLNLGRRIKSDAECRLWDLAMSGSCYVSRKLQVWSHILGGSICGSYDYTIHWKKKYLPLHTWAGAPGHSCANSEISQYKPWKLDHRFPQLACLWLSFIWYHYSTASPSSSSSDNLPSVSLSPLLVFVPQVILEI